MKQEQLKISIRFFNDREVRAVWDDEHSKWWFSVLDIVGVLNEEADYTKVRNYWKYLKAKLKKENSEVVRKTASVPKEKDEFTEAPENETASLEDRLIEMDYNPEEKEEMNYGYNQ